LGFVVMRSLLRAAKYAWAGPYTILGLIVGLALRGRLRRVAGVVEIEGPGIAWLLTRLPVRAAAMTLGHVVLGQSPWHLERTRAHERVHVEQFERWGPLFGPAYVLASLICIVRGQDFYRQNPFEIEAYRVDDPASSNRQSPGRQPPTV
jgi:hypothetical protein